MSAETDTGGVIGDAAKHITGNALYRELTAAGFAANGWSKRVELSGGWVELRFDGDLTALDEADRRAVLGLVRHMAQRPSSGGG